MQHSHFPSWPDSAPQLIAVATGRVEGADLEPPARFDVAVRDKAARLGELLRAKHGPGETTHEVAEALMGGVVVRVTWRASAKTL